MANTSEGHDQQCIFEVLSHDHRELVLRAEHPPGCRAFQRICQERGAQPGATAEGKVMLKAVHCAQHEPLQGCCYEVSKHATTFE